VTLGSLKLSGNDFQADGPATEKGQQQRKVYLTASKPRCHIINFFIYRFLLNTKECSILLITKLQLYTSEDRARLTENQSIMNYLITYD